MIKARPDVNYAASKKPALFLDRDGVIVHDKGYVFRPEDLKVLPGVAAFLKKAQGLDYYLIVITNQSGVARGYFNLQDVDAFHRCLDAELWQQAGVKIDRYYTCPHHPKGNRPEYTQVCSCRKPATGMIEQALQDLPIDLGKSVLIGDKESDIECGIRLGISTIQVNHGQYPLHPNPGLVVHQLTDNAMEWIVTQKAIDNTPK